MSQSTFNGLPADVANAYAAAFNSNPALITQASQILSVQNQLTYQNTFLTQLQGQVTFVQGQITSLTAQLAAANLLFETALASALQQSIQYTP